jgi:tRNA(fMet)-specific endonuclease VapC
MIADTTFLIDFLVKRPDAILFAKNNHIVTTAISVFEVYQGAKITEFEGLDEFFNEFMVLKFGKEEAVLAGKIALDLKKKGEIIDFEDCMIASIALIKDVPIITKNLKHFNRIKNLKIISY